MPLFKRSRPSPRPSHNAPFSLTLFNTPYHILTSSQTPLNLLHLICNTASSIHEAHRLLNLKSSLLHPTDREWITRVITDTETALHEIAQLIIPARATRRPAILEIPLLDNSKSPWFLDDSRHARDLHSRLSWLHGSLMSALSVLYLSDLRWVFVAAKPPPPQNEREASPPAPPAYESVVSVAAIEGKSLEKPQGGITKQHPQLWNGPQTTHLPITTPRVAIDDPYTWQPPSSPPPPPGGGKEKLQHSKSDPTPAGHPYDNFRHVLYRHENISSSYLEGCRLTEPWSVDFAVADEEGVGFERESGASIRRNGDGLELELPPKLSTLMVKRRWSSDVLGV